MCEEVIRRQVYSKLLRSDDDDVALSGETSCRYPLVQGHTAVMFHMILTHRLKLSWKPLPCILLNRNKLYWVTFCCIWVFNLLAGGFELRRLHLLFAVISRCGQQVVLWYKDTRRGLGWDYSIMSESWPFFVCIRTDSVKLFSFSDFSVNRKKTPKLQQLVSR